MAEEDGAVEHTLRRPRVLETTLPHPEAVSRVERYRSHDRQGAEDLVHETRLRADAAFDDDVASRTRDRPGSLARVSVAEATPPGRAPLARMHSPSPTSTAPTGRARGTSSTSTPERATR